MLESFLSRAGQGWEKTPILQGGIIIDNVDTQMLRNLGIYLINIDLNNNNNTKFIIPTDLSLRGRINTLVYYTN